MDLRKRNRLRKYCRAVAGDYRGRKTEDEQNVSEVLRERSELPV